MRVGLMFPDAELSPGAMRPSTEALPAWQGDLARDLGLPALWAAMADGDPYLWGVARSVTLDPVADTRTIRHRQAVLSDLRAHPEAALRVYEIACEAAQGHTRIRGMLRRTPSSTLRHSIEAIELFVPHLRRLRAFGEHFDGRLTSQGLGGLVAMLLAGLGDEYFAEVDAHLARLRFKGGIRISAQLGDGNKGTGYVLRMPPDARTGRRTRAGAGASRSASFEVHARDEAGREALARLEDRGLNLAADALAQAADHIAGFFAQLRTEVAFYLGCLNLERHLSAAGAPTCEPEPIDPGLGRTLSASGIYDPTLVLRTGSAAVGNDVDADGRKFVMITGANSGGKSTLLRAIGIAQLMMEAGMGVCATRYRASLCGAVFTHVAANDEMAAARGRLDAELSRMREIAERLTPDSLVLFNESFAGTTEWEGSEVAREIVQALVDVEVRVIFVTHLHHLAESLFTETSAPSLFLRAERRDDGTRTFKMLEGSPLATSFGPDLYERVGGFWRRGTDR